VAAGPRARRVFAVVEPTFSRSIQTRGARADRLLRGAEALGAARETEHASFDRWADALRRGGLLAGTIARDAVVDQGIAEEALAR